MANGYYIKVEPVAGLYGLELQITVSDKDPDTTLGRLEKKAITLTDTVKFNRCGYLCTPFGASKLRMKRKCERIINKLSDRITMIKQLAQELTKKDGVSRATRRLEKK